MRISSFRRAVAMTALLVATPALAQGKKERAEDAVVAARAKVDIANKLQPVGEVPRLQAAAAAALRLAEDDLKADRKVKAVETANRAQQLAEEAIGISQREQANATNAAQTNAQVQAAQAQAAAADANARAAAAEQAAAQAQAQAAAARATPVVVAQPAPAETTVTTETTAAPAPRVTTTKRVVRRPVRRTTAARSAAPAVRTTTTVSTN
jgi:hypothetical protein